MANIPAIIAQNPYRVLGVYTTAHVKDRIAKANRIRAYVKVGKAIDFTNDFDSILPQVDRSVESIERATSKLNLPKDQLEFALFWFANIDNSDEASLTYLSIGNINKAKEIMSKGTTFSSQLNIGILNIIVGDVAKGIQFIESVIHNQLQRNSFVKSVCGSNFVITEDELLAIFKKSLFSSFTTHELSIICQDLNSDSKIANILQEELVESYETQINALLSAFNNKKPTIKDALQLLLDCEPLLIAIKERTSEKDKNYVRISTSISNVVLNKTIDVVNQAIAQWNSLDDNADRTDYSKTRDNLIETLSDAWQATLDMDVMVKEPYFENGRYKDNRTRLYDVINKLNGFADAISTLFSYNPFVGFANSIKPRLVLKVDDEFIKSCKSIDDYKQYLKRFPNGKHIVEAKTEIKKIKARQEAEKRKREELEKKRVKEESNFWQNCKAKEDFALYLTKYPYGKYSKEAKKLKEEQEKQIAKKKKRRENIKTTFIIIGIAVALLALIFLIWGVPGLGNTLIGIGAVSGFVALFYFGGLFEGEFAECIGPVLGFGALAFILIGSGYGMKSSYQDYSEYQALVSNYSIKAADNFLDKRAYGDDYFAVVRDTVESTLNKEFAISGTDTTRLNGFIQKYSSMQSYVIKDIVRKAEEKKDSIIQSEVSRSSDDDNGEYPPNNNNIDYQQTENYSNY